MMYIYTILKGTAWAIAQTSWFVANTVLCLFVAFLIPCNVSISKFSLHVCRIPWVRCVRRLASLQAANTTEPVDFGVLVVLSADCFQVESGDKRMLLCCGVQNLGYSVSFPIINIGPGTNLNNNI
jgi:hypothetical protein